MKVVVMLVVIKVKMIVTDHFIIYSITSGDTHLHVHTILFMVKAASVNSGRQQWLRRGGGGLATGFDAARNWQERKGNS